MYDKRNKTMYLGIQTIYNEHVMKKKNTLKTTELLVYTYIVNVYNYSVWAITIHR